MAEGRGRPTDPLEALRRAVEAAREAAAESLRRVEQAEAALAAVEAGSGAASHGEIKSLTSTVERLDLGTLALDQPARGSFELTGGPGRIVVDTAQVIVEPLQFGPGVTRIQVESPPMKAGGVLLTALRAVTPSEIVEIPVFARWAAAPAAAQRPTATPAPSPTPSPAAAPIVVKTLLVVSRVTGFPRALALQRAVQQVPGVTEAKAVGYEHAVLNLQVMHEARVNLAEEVTHLRGFPLRLIESSLGRLQLAAEGR